MIVRYEIDYWNDIDQEPATEKGIAGAGDTDTIGEVVNRIYDYCGKENVTSLKVYECMDIMCDEEINTMLEENV